MKYQHQQIEHEKLMAQKSDMINDLLRKKQEAETKFLVAQNSSQGYANAKANYDEFQKDREKFAQELLAKDEEINSLKVLHRKMEILENNIEFLKNTTIIPYFYSKKLIFFFRATFNLTSNVSKI